jgi:hypothetical protein
MPSTNHVRGTAGVNYRLAPDTPVLDARAGDPVRIHVAAPYSEQAQVFSVEGHRWPEEPGLAGTPWRSSQAVAGGEALTFRLDGGAGGPDRLAGVYAWEDHRLPYAEAGLRGRFVVRPPGAGSGAEVAAGTGLRLGRLEPLAASHRRLPAGVLVLVVGVVGAVLATLLVQRRRRHPRAEFPSRPPWQKIPVQLAVIWTDTSLTATKGKPVARRGRKANGAPEAGRVTERELRESVEGDQQHP